MSGSSRYGHQPPVWYWFASTAAIAAGAVVGVAVPWVMSSAVLLALDHVEDRRQKARRRRAAEVR